MNSSVLPTRAATLEWVDRVSAALVELADQETIDGVNRAATAYQTDRLCLAVIGKAKRGKSTLVNALLGRRDDTVAPIDRLPASSTISRFRQSATDGATVVYRNGRREGIAFHRIRDFVTEEGNPGNTKGVNLVEIESPFPRLSRDLELVDTPGAASVHEHHDALLHAFIPHSDAVIFLVTARMPLDQDELDLLRQVQAADIHKIFFVVNRADECDEQDLADAVAHNQRLLADSGVVVDRMHSISAKHAYEGDWEQSGVADLFVEISQYLDANKGQVLQSRLISRIRSLATPVLQAAEVRLASCTRTDVEIDEELRQLSSQKRSLEAERGLVEREFSLAWTKAVDLYEQGVREAKGHVTDAILAGVRETHVSEITALAKSLPTTLTRRIEAELAPIARRFEDSAREACERLQASYPAINVREAGHVSLSTSRGFGGVTGAVGGVAAAAAGAGFAAAGASAAAAIATANAAAAAATTMVAAPSVLAGLATWLGLPSFLVNMGVGITTVAAPAAMTATPLWVALSGPVGWTLAGVGVLAVPFSWRLSKVKLKQNLEREVLEQINDVFRRLDAERMPALRGMGKTISQEICTRLDRQLIQIENALLSTRQQRPSPAETDALSQRCTRLRTVLEATELTTPAPPPDRRP